MKTSLRGQSASEWRLHWTVLLACVAGVTLSTVHTYTLGVMIGPLEQEFGWSRAQISTGPLILAVIALFTAPLVGLAVDKFGPRRIALFGVVLFCSALALLSTANADIVSWWLLWVLMALGAMSVAPIVWTAAVTSLFSANRGMALAIALCGAGLGGMLVPRITHQLVEAYEWRGAYIALALMFGAIVLPLTLFLFHGAADRHRAQDKKAAQAALPGMTPRAAFTSARFLKLAAAAAIISFAVCTLIANAVPILVSEGHPRASAASIAGLVGLGAIFGRLGGGYLLDRLDANLVAAASVLAPIITAAILIIAPGDALAASFAFLILGLAVGTELDACAYLAARHFGLKSFGTLFGVINGMLLFANGVAPLIANHIYDVTRSYDAAVWAVIPACLISATLFATLGPYAVFDQAPAAEKAT